MTVPDSQDILSIAHERVPAFIQSHVSSKTLSRIVQRLNADLLDGDERASEMAARALYHLGLSERLNP